MGRLFGQYATPPAEAFPPVNVYTDGEGAAATAELPGVDPKDLDITVHDRTLVMRGERKPLETGKDDARLRQERVFGRFTRSVDLPFADALAGLGPARVNRRCRPTVSR